MITIGGFVVGGVIICILIYVIAQALGFVGGGRDTAEGNSASSASATVTATATPTPVDSSATSNAGEEQVTVPDLRGKTEEEAQQTANEMGLGVTSGGTEPSDSVEAGKICCQFLSRVYRFKELDDHLLCERRFRQSGDSDRTDRAAKRRCTGFPEQHRSGSKLHRGFQQ